jgi:DNA (cytosine-5)-methyltransferase 1
MTKPTFGSLFAGVGGFDLGFESAGYECRFQVEWDKQCQQTLAYHWPDVPRWGDVSEVNGADLPPVDVVTYGFPCQDLSIAGARAGLDGDRSNLFFQAVRTIKEMREATNGRYPTWAVAENVPGLLNADGGSAMARVLDTLADAGAMVIEWCVLDAQWFGVPQRRRRIFIAACFDPATADRCPNQIFPVAPSGTRNPAASEQARQTTARIVANSIDETVQRDDGLIFAPYTTTAVCSKWAKGSSGPSGDETRNMVAFVKSRRAQSTQDVETWIDGAPNPTLNQFDAGDSRTTTAIVHDDLAVRRLTPIECERLQGFPDNHTLHRSDGKQNSDSTRYKMIGNAIAVPVSQWVAQQLTGTL